MFNTADCQKVVTSAVTLAVIADITATLIPEIAGNDVGVSINNSPITKNALVNMAVTRINQKLKDRANGL